MTQVLDDGYKVLSKPTGEPSGPRRSRFWRNSAEAELRRREARKR